MEPETRVLPVLVVVPLTVPETVAPSSAAVPLKVPAMVALVKEPPPVPFKVSGAASVPPVKRQGPVTVSVPLPLAVPALLEKLPMVSAVLTEKWPALVTVAVSDRLPWSTKFAPRATVTGVLVEVPVKVKVPPFTASEPPPMFPDTKVLPMLVVGPFSAPETMAPSSAAVPLKVPARRALANVPPPVPFTVSGAASVPPVKVVTPVTVSVPVPSTVPAGNTALNTVVTAQDGVTTKTYLITVTRLPQAFVFNAATDVPVTANGFATGGYPATLTLNHAPVPGTVLTMVNNEVDPEIQASG